MSAIGTRPNVLVFSGRLVLEFTRLTAAGASLTSEIVTSITDSIDPPADPVARTRIDRVAAVSKLIGPATTSLAPLMENEALSVDPTPATSE